MINSINLNQLRNAGFVQFCKDFTRIIDLNNPSALSVQAQYDAMVSKIVELESLLFTATANPMTAEIEALDLRRDKAINGIIINVDSYTYFFDVSLRSAAAALQNNLQLYSAGIARENYHEETAIVSNLVSDWENQPELVAAVSTLNLGIWITELKAANDDFRERYIDRTQDYGRATPDNLKGKRAEMLETYYKLRKRLDAYSEIEATPAYEKTMNELNALIMLYNDALKSRLKPRKKKGADAVDPN